MLSDIKKLLLTFLLCLVVGFGFKQLSLPAPYLVGSLLGTWVIGGLLSRLCGTWLPDSWNASQLGVPRWFHISVVLGLSTLIGATFHPDMLSKLSLWAGTVFAMLLATVIATTAGYYFLHRVRHYESKLALLCSLPGGQAEVIALSRDLVEKDYVVAFCHLVRVVIVVCLIPLLLALTQGSEGVAASYVATAQLPGVLALSWLVLGQFVGIGLVGYLLAKWLKIPIPHLLGPLLLSSGLHLMGLVTIPRINEFIILAQITIGGAVGAKLAQINLKELLSHLWDAIANAIIVIGIYVGIAVLLATLGGLEPMKMVLAFIPGGIYEVTVLALVFGFDVAFVAFHHTVRVLLIFLSLPFLARRMKS